MPAITDTLPLPTDLESSAVTLDRWSVDTPAERDLVAEAVLTSWAAHDLPPGLETITSLTSSRGDTVLSLQQWSDPAAQEEWHRRLDREGRPGGGIAPAEHLGTQHFSHYHSVVHHSPFHHRGAFHDSGAPLCLVLVTFDFDTTVRALRWTDLLVEAIEGDEEPTPGCLSRHLFLGWDHRSVLNYSLWMSEDDHRRSLEAPATSASWRRIEGFPGLTHGPGARCRLHGTVENSGASSNHTFHGGQGPSA